MTATKDPEAKSDQNPFMINEHYKMYFNYTELGALIFCFTEPALAPEKSINSFYIYTTIWFRSAISCNKNLIITEQFRILYD
jgi:hypothetical protein